MAQTAAFFASLWPSSPPTGVPAAWLQASSSARFPQPPVCCRQPLQRGDTTWMLAQSPKAHNLLSAPWAKVVTQPHAPVTEESPLLEGEQGQAESSQAPARPRVAHLVVLLKQPLQELVAQVVELRGAARGQAEPAGRDPSEQLQRLLEPPTKGSVRGPSAKPHLAQGTWLTSPSLPNKTPTKPNKAVGEGLEAVEQTPRGTSMLPKQPRSCHSPRSASCSGPSASPSAFHQQEPCCLPLEPALWGEAEAARSRSLSLLADQHLWGGTEQRRDSSCRTSQEGSADSSLLATAHSSGRGRTAFTAPR